MDSKLDDIAKPLSSGKRKTIAGLGITGLLIALYAVYWFHLAGQLRGQVENETANLVEQGFQASYETLSITGFPGDITLILKDASIADSDGWKLGSKKIVGVLSPFNPTKVTLTLEGSLKAALPINGRLRAFDGAADTFRAEIGLGGKATRWQGDLRVENLEMVEAKSGDVLGVNFLKVQAQANDVPDPSAQQSAYDLLIRANDTTLPKRLSSPWGNRIKEAAFEASLMGRIPKAHSINEALATWRDIGGTAQILRFTIDQGPVHLTSDGTLALDGNLQPVGRAVARVSGYMEIIDALVDRKVMRSRDAPLAKMVLGTLAKRPDTGGRAVLNVPITLKNQTLYAGPIALSRLAPVKWDFLKNLM